MSFFTEIPKERLHAWLDACRAQFEAEAAKTDRALWKKAGVAWDALVKLHTPLENDRFIYDDLAKKAWLRAAGTRPWLTRRADAGS